MSGVAPVRWIIRRGTGAAYLFSVAGEERWVLTARARRSYFHGTTYGWKTATEGTVTWAEEPVLGVCRVDVEGDVGDRARLRGRLPCLERDELLKMAFSDQLPESLDGLRSLAVLESAAPSAELLSLLRHKMGHPHFAVRSAVWRMACLGFIELLPDVARCAEEDEEFGELRGSLRDMLIKGVRG